MYLKQTKCTCNNEDDKGTFLDLPLLSRHWTFYQPFYNSSYFYGHTLFDAYTRAFLSDL